MRIIYISINTTGLDSKEFSIFQLSLAAFDDGEIVKALNYVILDDSIEASDYLLANYDIDKLYNGDDNAYSFVNIQGEVAEFLTEYKDYIIACYDKQFTMSFINNMTNLFNRRDIIDLKDIFRYMCIFIYDEKVKHSLSDLFTAYGIDINYLDSFEKVIGLGELNNLISRDLCQKMNTSG